MAETLTFEQKNEVTSVENLSSEEQDSLRIGEGMQEAQDGLLAGKYKDAQELESAYIELQKKLGGNTTEPTEEEASPEPEEDSQETPEGKKEDKGPNILDEIWEQSQGDKGFTKETIEQVQKMDPNDLVSMHLDYRSKNAVRDLTEKDVTTLHSIAGGKEGYSNMLKWAEGNLNENEIGMFDEAMDRGDPLLAFFAVRSLAYRYNESTGYEGKMVTGTAPKQSTDVFRSQAEVVKAMSDSRYDNDPAYRQDIMKKLERSPNVNF